MSETFWNKVWLQTKSTKNRVFISPDPNDAAFLEAIGHVKNKEVLDLGCGNGELAIYLAGMGAKVLAVDNSEQAIINTQKLAAQKKIALDARLINAYALSSLNRQFDLIVGRFILHHLEPFDEFVPIMQALVKPGGWMVFLENNARNKILMFFRRYVVGRFGVRKIGDAEEHPLEPKEIDLLKKNFKEVVVSYPRLMLLDLVGVYFFPKSFRIRSFFSWLDRVIYAIFPFLGKYSYRQLIEIKKAP
ncbi:MAG: class I SAM-dependent methyltransferase [Candidatus Doudnabacteria bacterium]|nr:class I SAM-dependent methyltransferase [Candidatus Doudnabacteria bacterium]